MCINHVVCDFVFVFMIQTLNRRTFVAVFILRRIQYGTKNQAYCGENTENVLDSILKYNVLF